MAGYIIKLVTHSGYIYYYSGSKDTPELLDIIADKDDATQFEDYNAAAFICQCFIRERKYRKVEVV